ncbi:maleylpyruvate isomerase N-terminal domain-containing protein [Streptomyces nojiriensis]
MSRTALRAAVAGLADQDFERPSCCAGRLVRDLVWLLVIDAQDVLITSVTPAGAAEPTVDAVTYGSSSPPGRAKTRSTRWSRASRRRTGSRGGSSSASTTSVRPPVGPPYSPTPRPASARRARR